MELASICLFIVFSIFIANNFHKAVLIIGPVFILCQPYMCLRYDSPAISLTFITQFLFITFSILKKRKIRFSSFPLYKAFIFLFFSLGLGFIVSPQNKINIAPWLLSSIISYLFVILYYNEIRCLSDAKLSLKALLFSAALLFTYFIFEFSTQSNPFIQYMFSLLGMDKGWVYPITERFGAIRCQSFMSICIAWGGFCSLIIATILLTNKLFIFNTRKGLLSAMLCIAIIGVYSCGSRSAYLFLFCILFYLFFYLKGRQKILLYICTIFGSLSLLPSIISYIGGLFAEDIEGSNLTMRQMQLSATISAIKHSPIWGYGIKGFELALSKESDILGAESIWLQTMISYGIIGVIMQLYLYISCWNFIKIYGKNSALCKLTLIGWIVFCTATTSPGLIEPYFLLILILLCKIITYSYNSNGINNNENRYIGPLT